jgi:hypothetical protein
MLLGFQKKKTPRRLTMIVKILMHSLRDVKHYGHQDGLWFIREVLQVDLMWCEGRSLAGFFSVMASSRSNGLASSKHRCLYAFWGFR